MNPTLKEIVDASNELITRMNQHPALANIKVKVETNDLLDEIAAANALVAEVDDNIRVLHKSVRSTYGTRFPELIVADPLQYIMTVQLLKNSPQRVTTDQVVKNKLSEILDPKAHLLVTMTAATTQGIKLEEEEMQKILSACTVAVHLNNLKAALLKFVERNMATIAPNLSVIVGASIAARLMGFAGGLTQLATMPSCNVPALGSNLNGSTKVGLIYECDLIQQIPFDHTKDVRKKAVKWVANKCVLAARCDLSQSDLSGQAGMMLKGKIESLINKELEPPPKKAARPLPAPIEKSGKQRGGKRVRRMKERYAQTELRKAANRINFGDVGDDAYQNDLGLGRSQLNAIQKLRGPQINEKTKIRLSKSTQKKLADCKLLLE